MLLAVFCRRWACSLGAGPLRSSWLAGKQARLDILSFDHRFQILCLLVSCPCFLFSVILLPIAITFYITWWFIHFVDGFFSPIYAQLGINIFGKHYLHVPSWSILPSGVWFFWFGFFVGFGFLTSIAFIFLVGVFMSSWLGASVLNLGEWFIKRMPFVRHIYNASKQISTAISPGLFLENEKKTHFLHSQHYSSQSYPCSYHVFFWQIKIHKLSRKLQSSGIHV